METSRADGELVRLTRDADVRTTTGLEIAAFNAFFVREADGWKLWTTTRR